MYFTMEKTDGSVSFVEHGESKIVDLRFHFSTWSNVSVDCKSSMFCTTSTVLHNFSLYKFMKMHKVHHFLPLLQCNMDSD